MSEPASLVPGGGVPLGFVAFAAAMAADLELGDIPVTASSGLFDELGLDSFDAFRLLLLIEDLAGVGFPEEVPPELWTAGDAYDWYLKLADWAWYLNLPGSAGEAGPKGAKRGVDTGLWAAILSASASAHSSRPAAGEARLATNPSSLTSHTGRE